MVRGKTVVLGVSGSIAAYKAAYLCRRLVEAGAEVWPVLTPAAARFIAPLTLSALSGRRAVVDLWSAAEAGEIGHVELAHRADLLLLAPATADLLNRLAAGRAGDPLCAIALATSAPWLVAPAMETGMWSHPNTQASLTTLAERGATVVAPEPGELASGRSGLGRLVEPEVLVEHAQRALTAPTLRGVRLVVTAGPTREHIDPVRFISNPSSGKMGFAIARQAWRRGAEVVLVSGPTTLPAPPGVERVDVETTQGMLEACEQHIDTADVLVMAGAPADYRPVAYSGAKIKKAAGPSRMQVEMENTPDIIQTLRQRASHCTVVGFAAESHDLLAHARDKLDRKKLDLIVANDITEAGSGFAHDTNRVVLLDRDGGVVELPQQNKEEVAAALLDRVEKLRG